LLGSAAVPCVGATTEPCAPKVTSGQHGGGQLGRRSPQRRWPHGRPRSCQRAGDRAAARPDVSAQKEQGEQGEQGQQREGRRLCARAGGRREPDVQGHLPAAGVQPEGRVQPGPAPPRAVARDRRCVRGAPLAARHMRGRPALCAELSVSRRAISRVQILGLRAKLGTDSAALKPIMYWCKRGSWPAQEQRPPTAARGPQWKRVCLCAVGACALDTCLHVPGRRLRPRRRAWRGGGDRRAGRRDGRRAGRCPTRWPAPARPCCRPALASS